MTSITVADVVVIAGGGLCYASVCVPVTADRDALLSAINAVLGPTGLDHGWQFSKNVTFSGGQPNPCPCEQEPGRAHFLMEC